MSEEQQISWAAIFDWDGIVVDSGPLHELAWEDTAARECLPLFDGHFEQGFGHRNEVIIPKILKWAEDPAEVQRLAELKESLFRERVKNNGILLLPGVKTLLEGLREQQIPCAIGSSTFRENIECVLQLLGLDAFFQGLVSGCDVSRGKPAPDVFLLSAKCLAMPPERCVVFEDSLVGIKAGKAAGMSVVGVATTHPVEKLEEADVTYETLEDVTPQILFDRFFAAPQARP